MGIACGKCRFDLPQVFLLLLCLPLGYWFLSKKSKALVLAEFVASAVLLPGSSTVTILPSIVHLFFIFFFFIGGSLGSIMGRLATVFVQ